ncbi:hypothetical protein [Halomonas chromatireducens]|uniref:hypothetical protein n=1 Tax=Halomonas chromatireducens TaxID=507626 RepID=UPI0011873EC7|nr:hypothetical protein [Halomonas chromatireducens]
MVPLFVFVSAAVSADGAQRRLEQGHASTKEDREDGHHLLIGEQMTEQPDRKVGAAQVAPHRGIGIGRHWHGEGLDIHDQDAEQGKATQHVQGVHPPTGR